LESPFPDCGHILPRVNVERTWKEYEAQIAAYFRAEYTEAVITANAQLPGRFSKIDRQIDLLVESQTSDLNIRLVVDAKHFKERIDVCDVEQFLSFLRDVGADIGVMISPKGYSEAAVNRAFYDDSRVILDVLNLADLQQYQAFGAIPFADGCGVLLPAPFGWLVDGRISADWLACLYPRGQQLAGAIGANEWIYVKISPKYGRAKTLEELLAVQRENMMKLPNPKICMLPSVQRADKTPNVIRKFETDRYEGFIEYTGFLDLETAVFFCVLFTPPELAEKNVRNLRYILRKALPVGVRYREGDSIVAPGIEQGKQ
jgi:hypothetical protein